MSEEVYKILDNKSKDTNELSAYINRLVENDLDREHHKRREDKLLSLMQEMLCKFEVLQGDILLRPTISVGYQEIVTPHNRAIGHRYFSEGQLVNDEEVTGKIEETIELDL
jgi:hypothetical protein